MCCEFVKSKGHVIFIGNCELYLDGNGDLFKADKGNVIDCITGYRIGRWEAPSHLAESRIKMLTEI